MVSFGDNYNTMGFDYGGGSSYGDNGGYGSGQNGDGYGWSDDYSYQEGGGSGFGQGYGRGKPRGQSGNRARGRGGFGGGSDGNTSGGRGRGGNVPRGGFGFSGSGGDGSGGRGRASKPNFGNQGGGFGARGGRGQSMTNYDGSGGFYGSGNGGYGSVQNANYGWSDDYDYQSGAYGTEIDPTPVGFGGGYGHMQGHNSGNRGRGRSKWNGDHYLGVRGARQAGVTQSKKRPHESISPSRWQSMYDKPLPKFLLSQCTPDKCSLCDVPFNGPTISRSHYDGKAHEKKVAQYLNENVEDESSRPKRVKLATPPADQTDSSLYCTVCNLACTSQVVYDSHMQGKTHASKVRAAAMAKNTREMANKLGCPICNIYVTSQDALTTHLAGKQHKKKSEKLGEIKSGVQLRCELCDVTATDKHGLDAHLNGKRHAEKVAGPKVKTDKGKVCNKCQVRVDTDEAWQLHVEGEAHKLTVAKLELSAKAIDYNTYEFNSFKEEEKEKGEEAKAE